MKNLARFILPGIALCLGLFITSIYSYAAPAAQKATPTPSMCRYTVSSNGKTVNVYNFPSLDAKVVAALGADENAQAFGALQDKSWLKLENGWVSSADVQDVTAYVCKVIGLSLFPPIITPVPLSPNQPTITPPADYVITPRFDVPINIRSLPDLKAKVVAVLKVNDRANVIGKSPDGLWLKLSNGWVEVRETNPIFVAGVSTDRGVYRGGAVTPSGILVPGYGHKSIPVDRPIYNSRTGNIVPTLTPPAVTLTPFLKDLATGSTCPYAVTPRNATATVYSGPGVEYDPVFEMVNGEIAEVLAYSTDHKWLKLEMGWIEEAITYLYAQNGSNCTTFNTDLPVVDEHTGAVSKFVPTATWTPIPTLTPETYCDKTTMQALTSHAPVNIRSGPGFQYPVVGALPVQQKIMGLGEEASHQWVKVESGWIHKSSLRTSWDNLPQTGCTDVGRLGIVPTPANLLPTIVVPDPNNTKLVCSTLGAIENRLDSSIPVRKQPADDAEVVGTFNYGESAAVLEWEKLGFWLRIDKGWLRSGDVGRNKCELATATPNPLTKNCKAIMVPSRLPFHILDAPSANGRIVQKVTNSSFRSEIIGYADKPGGVWYRVKEGWAVITSVGILPSPGCNITQATMNLPEIKEP